MKSKIIAWLMMILVVLGIMSLLSACATTNIEEDAEYMTYRAKKVAELQEKLQAKDVIISINMYIENARSQGDLRFKHPLYADDMRKTLLKYEDAVKEHNIIVKEKWAEDERESQRKRQEMYLLMVRGVPGDAKWIVFQEKFDMINLYATLIEQDNITMVLYKLNQYHEAMLKDEKELSSLTPDQEKWVRTAGGELVRIAIVFNTNVNPSFEHSRRNAITFLHYLMELRAGQ